VTGPEDELRILRRKVKCGQVGKGKDVPAIEVTATSALDVD